MFRIRSIAITIASGGLLVGNAQGQSASQHVDANPYANDGGISVGFYDFDTETFVPESLYFAEPLEIVDPEFIGVSAPGFFTTTDNPLLPNANLSFDVPAVSGPVSPDTPRNALYWDGLGDVQFGDLPADHNLQVRLSRFVNTPVDGGPTDATGFVLDQTSGEGTIHKHVAYLVENAAGTTPDDGLYLLPFQLHQPGLDSSDVFYLLFNGKYERDEQGDIIYNGIIPLVDTDAQADAEAWLEGLFAVDLLAGDYNASGSVEQGDLDLVLNNWGGPRGDWANADGFASANVDQEELDRVLNQWGSSVAPSFSGGSVPEPALALPALGVFGLLRRRR